MNFEQYLREHTFPRIMQPIRLNFTLVSADDDQIVTGSTPDSSPVCGWLLPNHLDGGLAVFDADGRLLGELIVMGGPSRWTTQWQPVPGGSTSVGDLPQINNLHLLGFVNSLVSRTKVAVQSLTNLLSVIDETLWTVDPLGGRSDQNLSVLIGRPLALVRAELGFELEGGPKHSRDYKSSDRREDWQQPENQPDFTKVNFPVCLGSLTLENNGLLGYFLNDDYGTFNSVHPLRSELKPADPPYISSIGASVEKSANPLGANYIPLQFNPGSKANVTMLLDPRGKVCANTGVLPTKDVILPVQYVENPLSAMQVTFRTAPLVPDHQELGLPPVTNNQGNWTWIEGTSVTDWETATKTVKTDEEASFPDQPLPRKEQKDQP